MTTPYTGKINRNVGIVEAVIDNGQRIVLRGLRGGKRICRNKGFEVGELLCYTINLKTGTIVELIPKKVADTLVFLGENTEIQRLMEDEPHGNIDDDAFDCGEGPQDTWMVDCSIRETGETHIVGADHGEYTTPNIDPNWDGNFHYVETEDRDTLCLPLPVPPESIES
jgi:sporulation protein YlmC with PRC-barrel domain